MVSIPAVRVRRPEIVHKRIMLTYIYLAAIAVAFLASLTVWRPGGPVHLRLFSVLLGLDLCTECVAVWMMMSHQKNSWLYNSFMLVEYWSYAYFFYRIIEFPRMKKIIQVYLVSFPVFWVFVVCLVTFHRWNSYVFNVGSFCTICFASVYYYQLFTRPDLVRLQRQPEYWIATGLILFYSCVLPLLGMLNFLVINFPMIGKLFVPVLDILNIILYSFITYAYLCRITAKRSLSR